MRDRMTASGIHYILNDVPILEDLSFELTAGSLHAILGPNGSGKSTLLKVLMGILKASSGTVQLNDQRLPYEESQRVSRLLALVPQNPMPTFDFLVQDIVAMGRYSLNRHYAQAVNDYAVREALEWVDAWHLRRRSINRLSSGERQRVYIARAVASGAPVLLLDEPTANLDISHQIAIWRLLQCFADKGKIIAVATHDLSFAEKYCSAATVLCNGHCTGSGSYQEIMTPKMLRSVFGVTGLPAADNQWYAPA